MASEAHRNTGKASFGRSLALGAIVGGLSYLGLEHQSLIDIPANTPLAAIGGLVVGGLTTYSFTTLGTDREWAFTKARLATGLLAGAATLGLVGLAVHSAPIPSAQDIGFDTLMGMIFATPNTLGPLRKRRKAA